MKSIIPKDRFISTVIFFTLLSIALCIALVQTSFYIFYLNENQVLYLISMNGQIIGGVFALTLTAYIFFADKLREIGLSNELYYEATLALRKKYFIDLTVISVVVASSILFCIIGIVMIQEANDIFYYILNQSTLLFIIALLSIMSFGTILLNPQKIDNEVRKLGKEAKIVLEITENDMTVSMEAFFTAYNKLDKVMYNISKALTKGYVSSDRPKIMQTINIMAEYQILTEAELREVNELRKYRNSVAHGLENRGISNIAYEKIKALTTKLEQKYESLQKE